MITRRRGLRNRQDTIMINQFGAGHYRNRIGEQDLSLEGFGTDELHEE